MASQTEATLTPWQEAADLVCAAVEAASQKTIKRATDDLYEKLLTETQNYLRENVEFNLSFELGRARRDAAVERATSMALRKQVAKLETALTEMLAVYWGDGDGELPEPACIERAKKALAAAQVS